MLIHDRATSDAVLHPVEMLLHASACRALACCILANNFRNKNHCDAAQNEKLRFVLFSEVFITTAVEVLQLKHLAVDTPEDTFHYQQGSTTATGRNKIQECDCHRTMYCPDAAWWLDFRSANRKSKTDAFAHVVLECFLDAAHGDEFEHNTQNKREKFLKTTEVVNPGAQVPAVGGAHSNPTNVHIMFPQQTCAEKCTRAAFGRTDPSEGSIHRTVPEAHRPLRRGACSRNVEIGGERKAEELRAMQRAQPIPSTPVADASTEVARLQQMVMELQKQLHSPFRIRQREDYVPATEQEVIKWMTDRQEDMRPRKVSSLLLFPRPW